MTSIFSPPPSSLTPDELTRLRQLTESYCCCADELGGSDFFDKWPVKVTIHSVDYETMQLSGEMEAFDVPDRTAPDCKSSITTYLEGEIIDLNQHTFETKNFRSSVRIDAIYWRKLLPFRGRDDVDIVQWLLSKQWLTEHISSDWILMRWKGDIPLVLFSFLFSFPSFLPPIHLFMFSFLVPSLLLSASPSSIQTPKSITITSTCESSSDETTPFANSFPHRMMTREMLHHPLGSTTRSDHLGLLLYLPSSFRWLCRRSLLRSR